jgi:predicted kinase
MTQPAAARRLVFVTGHPASGKSSLARVLAAELSWPLIEKDAIKERLFESVWTRVPESGAALGPATWELFYYILDVVMATASPAIAEGNFWPQSRPRLHALLDRHGYHPREVVLDASPDRLAARYLARQRNGERHAGHATVHRAPVQFLEETVRAPYEALQLGPEVLHVDTDDWAHVNTAAVAAWITAP